MDTVHSRSLFWVYWIFLHLNHVLITLPLCILHAYDTFSPLKPSIVIRRPRKGTFACLHTGRAYRRATQRSTLSKDIEATVETSMTQHLRRHRLPPSPRTRPRLLQHVFCTTTMRDARTASQEGHTSLLALDSQCGVDCQVSTPEPPKAMAEGLPFRVFCPAQLISLLLCRRSSVMQMVTRSRSCTIWCEPSAEGSTSASTPSWYPGLLNEKCVTRAAQALQATALDF